MQDQMRQDIGLDSYFGIFLYLLVSLLVLFTHGCYLCSLAIARVELKFFFSFTSLYLKFYLYKLSYCECWFFFFVFSMINKHDSSNVLLQQIITILECSAIVFLHVLHNKQSRELFCFVDMSFYVLAFCLRFVFFLLKPSNHD